MSKCFFFDTSALVKLYHEEAGTDELNSLIILENPVIVVSDIAIIEMTSAFAKKVRTGEIAIDLFDEAVLAFENDLSYFDIVNIDATIKTRASDLLKTIGLKKGLKTLDSLQIASALVFSEISMLDLFIAADGVMLKIAENEGLGVMAA